MEQLYHDNGCPLDMSKLELLSDRGSEFIVFKYFDLVIKIYKTDYQLTHLSLEELRTLKAIPTQRILFPGGFIWNNRHELMGYAMIFIDDLNGKISVDDTIVSVFFAEFEVLRQDLELICSHGVILRDINLSNTIYNGQVYLVDPGNYLINELKRIAYQPDVESLSPEEKAMIIREWNYGKINTLMDLMIFSKNDSIDDFTYWQIIQFFMKVKKDNGLIYNLDALRMYFNPDLSIRDTIKDFIRQNIKDDPKTRALFLSIYK